jgi:hypothetical protein
MASIFVQISAYRDKELTPTILNAIEQSSGKNQIIFGVHTVYIDESEINVPSLPNVRYVASKAPRNIGLGIGRALANQFYNGEDYYLQCDSHSRFVDGWDDILINSVLNYQIQGINKPLLTMYPGNYWYKSLDSDELGYDELIPGALSRISFSENPEQFKLTRNPTQTAFVPESQDNKKVKTVSGGSIFTVGNFVSFNRDIAFNGEEIFLAAKAFTNGYDILVPHEPYMYHLYYNHDIDPEFNKRVLLWKDFPEEFERLDKISKSVILKTLTEGTVGEYFLGTERTLEQFGEYAGLDFLNGEVLEKE